MARLFYDTSAILKRYHSESGSDVVDNLLAQPDNVAIISRLAIAELCSVFATQVRNGVLNRAQFESVQAFVIDDLVRGNLRLLQITAIHYERAEQLLSTLGLQYGLRTLDALHLAVALETHARNPIDYFVSSDVKLLNVAKVAGLATINPEHS